MGSERCRPSDLPELFDLFASCYPGNPRLREVDYFNWQYRDHMGRDGDRYTFLLYRSKGRIRSFLGYVPVEVVADSGVTSGCFLQNWMSLDKDGSGWQLFTQVAADFDVLLMMGTTPSAEALYSALNLPVCRLPRWVGIVEPAEVLPFFASPSPRLERQLHHDVLPRPILTSSVERIARFPEELRPDPARNAGATVFVSRRGSYLNWRYADAPRHSYELLKLGSEGYLVFRLEQVTGSASTVVRVMEWVVPEAEDEAALAAILSETRSRRPVLIDFFTTSASLGNRLAAIGFIPGDRALERPVPFLFRPLHYAGEIGFALDRRPHFRSKAIDLSTWYLTKGDGDLDRVKL